MEISNEAMLAVISIATTIFGGMSTAIAFLFKSYKTNVDNLRNETRRRIDTLCAQVEKLKDERAELMQVIGRLEGENSELRRRIRDICGEDHPRHTEHEEDEPAFMS